MEYHSSSSDQNLQHRFLAFYQSFLGLNVSLLFLLLKLFFAKAVVVSYKEKKKNRFLFGKWFET